MTVACADEDFRAGVLARHGAAGDVLDEVLAYTRGAFTPAAEAESGPFPLPDEPFVAVWEEYAEEAGRRGAWSVLRERLVQLRFPVAPGTSAREDYRAATRRGVVPAKGPGLALRAPAELILFLHPTPAGRIPVVVAGCREDFEALVQALTRRNEPERVPSSMGACIVGGYNNWDRIARLRRAWEAAHPGAIEADWGAEFGRIAARKELFQDRFILLSRGAYSAVSAEDVGLTPEAWAEASLRIRLEHECAHYFTRRVLGSMRNALPDELLADFAGITAVEGRFRADWFLRFMGLEDERSYRAGGRLENYRGTPPLSDAGFSVLQSLVRAATAGLAARPAPSAHPADRARALLALSRLSLEELARDRSA